MGNIKKITATKEIPDPQGWDPKEEQYNLPFTVELKENFHIHWQDLRIEMMSEDFENFVLAMNASYEKWKEEGKPKELEETKRYGCWPGEEGLDFYKERDKKYNKNNELCHHFRKFPRTESGKLFFDTKFQVELQKTSQYHIHYKNFRIELGKNRLKQMADAMYKSIKEND